MKAVKLTSVKKLELVEVPKPKSDGVKTVVKVSKVSICGTDLHFWETGGVSVGWIMGHEFSGTVEDPGAREDLKVGDRCMVIPGNPCGECHYCKKGLVSKCLNQHEYVGLGIDGAYSQYVMTRPDMVVPLPPQISDEEAALIEPSSVALRAAKRASINAGESVLIAGCGIIGILTAMWAKKLGAKNIVMTDVNDYRLNKVLEMGIASSIINAKDQNYVENCRALTKDSLGFDKYIDCVGNQVALNTNIETLRYDGHILMAGYPTELVPMNINRFVTKEIVMSSTFGYTVDEVQEVMNAIATKEIDLQRFITSIIKLEDIPEMFNTLHKPTNTEIKVIIDVQNS